MCWILQLLLYSANQEKWKMYEMYTVKPKQSSEQHVLVTSFDSKCLNNVWEFFL